VPKRSIPEKNPTILRSSLLSNLRWLVHGFSTRTGGFSRAYGTGDLNLGFTKDDSRAAVERNRDAFLRALCRDSGPNRPSAQSRGLSRRAKRDGNWSVITLRQMHSDVIHLVESVPQETFVGDGLITSAPGLLLAIQTADCLPVILVDPKHHAVGVLHAGWRGTAKRIVEKGVGEMFRHFASRSRDLKAAIGPGIQGCCYEVGEEVRSKFESQFAYAGKLFREVKEPDPVREKYPLLFLSARPPGHSPQLKKIYLDLVEANRQQLLATGVPMKNIETSSLCTNCNNDVLFSYRAERGKTGRLMGVAGIRGE